MFNVKCHCALIITSLILYIKEKNQKTKQNKRLEKKQSSEKKKRGKERKIETQDRKHSQLTTM